MKFIVEILRTLILFLFLIACLVIGACSFDSIKSQGSPGDHQMADWYGPGRGSPESFKCAGKC